MKAYHVNPSNYFGTNSAGAVTVGVCVQTVAMVNTIFAGPSNAFYDLDSIYGNVATNKTLNVLMKSVSSKLMLQNQYINSNFNVQIYNIISRRDLNNSTTIYDPTNTFTAGLTNEGAVPKEDVGVLPFSSRGLTQYFKICKVTHLIMSEGQTHVH